jgi:hypothetical protein
MARIAARRVYGHKPKNQITATSNSNVTMTGVSRFLLRGCDVAAGGADGVARSGRRACGAAAPQ